MTSNRDKNKWKREISPLHGELMWSRGILTSLALALSRCRSICKAFAVFTSQIRHNRPDAANLSYITFFKCIAKKLSSRKFGVQTTEVDVLLTKRSMKRTNIRKVLYHRCVFLPPFLMQILLPPPVFQLQLPDLPHLEN